MTHVYSPDYQVVLDIGCLCEYIYRKGVFDASHSGDPVEVKACAERDDNNTTLMFLRDSFGNLISHSRYEDHLAFFASAIKAVYLRNMLVNARGLKTLKLNICTICDKYYRDGLMDGIGVSTSESKKFLMGVKGGKVHDRINKPRIPNDYWMDTIRHDCNSIYYQQVSVGIKSKMNTLPRFIKSAIINDMERRG